MIVCDGTPPMAGVVAVFFPPVKHRRWDDVGAPKSASNYSNQVNW
tara:strand:+ start:146 stop:280 length:135 start_codon:yes stop_codon:yes gene_type:complete